VDIELLTRGYDEQIAGVLSCRDRVLIFGALPKICDPAGMNSCLYERGVRVFDDPRLAEPYRDPLRENAARLATEAGIALMRDRLGCDSESGHVFLFTKLTIRVSPAKPLVNHAVHWPMLPVRCKPLLPLPRPNYHGKDALSCLIPPCGRIRLSKWEGAS
jgi:hypothetical protein